MKPLRKIRPQTNSGVQIKLNNRQSYVMYHIRMVFAIALACTFAAFLWLHITPAKHTATMIIAPSAQQDLRSLANRIPMRDLVMSGFGLGGALSFLQSEDPSPFAQFQQTLSSAHIASTLTKDEQIMTELFPEYWDMENQTIEDRGWFREFFARLASWSLGQPYIEAPVTDLMQTYIDDHIRLSRIDQTGMFELRYRHPDSTFSKYFVGRLHHTADQHLKTMAQQETKARINYLQTQISKTRLTEHRAVLTNLLADQERLAMFISVDMPYAAQVVQGSTTGQKPDWPNPVLVLIGAFCFGGMIGILCLQFPTLLRQFRKHFLVPFSNDNT